MDNIDKKLKAIFPNLIVNKKFANLKEVSKLPRFISEYLIMKFTENEELNFKKLNEFLNKYYVSPEEKNVALYLLEKNASKELIDEFSVEMHILREKKTGLAIGLFHGLSIPSLQLKKAWIKAKILDENRDLLRGGVWGLGKLELSRRVLLLGLKLIDISEEEIITIFSLIWENKFKEKLEEIGFEVVIPSKNDPVFIHHLKKIWQTEKKEGESNIMKIEDLEDEILLGIGQEVLVNYIFRPTLTCKKQEKEKLKTIITIHYFSLFEKKWKIFQWEKEINNLKEDVIDKFLTDAIVNFLVKEKINPVNLITLTEFKPYQISSKVVDTIIENRAKFTTEEWVDIIIRSIGLNPDIYNKFQKKLLLVRLVPLVETNVNLIELGPKATGKTYIYRNTSIYTRIFAGGKVSPAEIFYHGTYKIIGEIGRRDCIVFDELSKVIFPEEMVSKLKDYMVDGWFERLGLKRAHSGCCLVFIDNIEGNEINIENLPPILSDSAFLDRIHGIIPGWEIPKILHSDIHLCSNYGFASDVLCEFFHKLRNKNFIPLIDEKIELIGEGITIRDEKAIKKVSSGLLKIIFPHENFTDQELLDTVDMAIQLRQNVNKILYRISPLEFPYKKITASLKR
ncbi:MAG: BREX system Lon protease-like protein BrxL [Candidatus Ratteibacteria bacterium]